MTPLIHAGNPYLGLAPVFALSGKVESEARRRDERLPKTCNAGRTVYLPWRLAPCYQLASILSGAP